MDLGEQTLDAVGGGRGLGGAGIRWPGAKGLDLHLKVLGQEGILEPGDAEGFDGLFHSTVGGDTDQVAGGRGGQRSSRQTVSAPALISALMNTLMEASLRRPSTSSETGNVIESGLAELLRIPVLL